MEVKVVQRIQFSTWMDSERISMKPAGSVNFYGRSKHRSRSQVLVSSHFRPSGASSRDRLGAWEVSCSYKNFPASLLESEASQCDEALLLKNKALEIEPYLQGRCVYLVGVMGSGKSTVGKILAQALGYSFSDSDTLIEQAVEGTSVAEIFRLYGEGFFRDKETEVLRQLSLMHRLVVSTGGGAVTRPLNWKYMRKGISVFLDVPLEALARRIAAVGTQSRPLLHHDSGDSYQKTFLRLSALWQERGESYKYANARVCVESIAKSSQRDILSIKPTDIVFEVLKQIESVLKDNGDMPMTGL